VLLAATLSAKLGRQVGRAAHVALQLTPQQTVGQPLTGQLAEARHRASKSLKQRRIVGHWRAQRSLLAQTTRTGWLEKHHSICTGLQCQFDAVLGKKIRLKPLLANWVESELRAWRIE
jgi:hypothetical protein